MFKKKITKKSLEELAKVMPVIEEWEMRTMIGGVEFRDYSGNCLGVHGVSSIVRFISPDDYQQISTASLTESQASNIGVGIGNLTHEQLNDISQNLIRMQGMQVASNTLVGYSGSPALKDSDAVTIKGSNNIYFNSNMQESLNLYTYADLASTLRHESIHLSMRTTVSGVTGVVIGTVEQNETLAIKSQVRGAEWQYTSYGYKLKTARYYMSFGHSDIESASLCGVQLSDLQRGIY